MHMPKYRVAEEFFSIQAEGPDAGTPAWFIRLAGCSLGCPFCDTCHIQRYERTAKELAISARKPYVVVTGGEPLEQDLAPLIAELGALSKIIAIETNCLYAVPQTKYNVKVIASPKPKSEWFVHPDLRVSAYKLLVTPELSSGVIAKFLATGVPVYLQPLWDDSKSLKRTLEYIDEYPVRMSFQWHKLFHLP